MKLPRDLSRRELMQLLARLGYVIDYRTVDHIRLSTGLGGLHHLTLPSDDFINANTRSSILTAVAEHLGLSREELIQILMS